MSPARRVGRRDGTVRLVCDDQAELGSERELAERELRDELNEAEAAEDANDDPGVGATGSGATVVSIVSQ